MSTNSTNSNSNSFNNNNNNNNKVITMNKVRNIVQTTLTVGGTASVIGAAIATLFVTFPTAPIPLLFIYLNSDKILALLFLNEMSKHLQNQEDIAQQELDLKREEFARTSLPTRHVISQEQMIKGVKVKQDEVLVVENDPQSGREVLSTPSSNTKVVAIPASEVDGHTHLVEFRENVTPVTCEAKPVTNTVKSAFDKAFASDVKSTNSFSKMFSTKEASVTVSINPGTQTLSIKKGDFEEVYNTRNYVVFTFDVEDERVCGVYNSTQALALVQSLINSIPSNKFNQVEELLKSLTSKIFVDVAEQRLARNEAFYGRRADLKIEGKTFIDQQLTVESNKISALGVTLTNNKFSVEKTEFNGKELSIVAAYFVALGQPVATDKNNKKYFIVGDGCRACGVDLIDGQLVTLNPIPRKDGHIKNGAKVLNRIASHGFLKADVASLLINNDVVGMTRSNLLFALSNSNYTCGAGVEVPVFVSFGGFGLNNGIMETNAANNVRFAFKQVKNLAPISVSLYAFSEEYRNSLGTTPKEQVKALKAEISKFILEWATNNKKLNAHQVVKFNNVVVIANPFHFEVGIAQEDHITVKLGGHNFNGEVRSVVVNVKATVISEKKSPKVRGLTKKATAFPTNTVITKDGVVQDWVAILNHNTIKGSSAILDIIANSDDLLDSEGNIVSPGLINSTVVWNKGVLTVDGKAWSQEDLIAWLEAKVETYVIKREISKTVADELRNFNGVEIVEENGTFFAVETVKGFFGFSVMEIEVSTADENHGISHLGLNEQQILALAGKTVSERLASIAGKTLKNADLLVEDNNKEIRVFKLNVPESAKALRSFLNINEEFRTKAWMGAMSKKTLHGIRVEWDFAKKDGSVHTWAADLPFGVFNKFGNWDKAGTSATSNETVINDLEGEEIVSSNILEDVFDFINIITSLEVSNEERKSAFLRSNMFTTWVEALKTAKKANMFTKAGVAFHQKVVGDLTIGNVAIGTDILPVVRIHPNNPMVANKELSAALKAGEAVVRNNAVGTLNHRRLAFLSRCPLPLFTAVIVEFDENLDDSVIAVNPVVWIRSNLGDFDGDLGYLTDGAQFNFNSIKQAGQFNKEFSSLFNGGEKANNAIKDSMGMGVNDTVVGADKPFASLTESWTEIANTVSVAELTDLAGNVHNHYKFAVGKLYNVASALTQTLGNNAFAGKSLNADDVKALMQAWYLYEEIGLGGWSVDNQTKIAQLEAEIKAVLKSGVVNEIRSVEERKSLELDIIELAMLAFLGLGNPLTLNAQGREALLTGTVSPRRRGSSVGASKTSDFAPKVIVAACNTVIGRKVQRGNEALGNKSAVVAQATRVIARKEITDNEANIFKAAKRVGLEGCRFAKQIEVIGALRLQSKKQ